MKPATQHVFKVLYRTFRQNEVIATLQRELQAKTLTPLLVRKKDKKEAKRLAESCLQRADPVMQKAKATFALEDEEMMNNAHNALILYHICLENSVSRTAIRDVISSKINPRFAPNGYRGLQRRLLNIGAEAKSESIEWLFKAIELIIEATDGHSYAGFWSTLSSKQRYVIYSAVYEQYPVWLLQEWRAKESMAVDFRELYAAGGASPCAQRQEWQSYFEAQFCDIADMIYRYGFMLPNLTGDAPYKAIVDSFWAGWRNGRKIIEKFGHLQPYDLPAVSGAIELQIIQEELRNPDGIDNWVGDIDWSTSEDESESEDDAQSDE